MWSLDGRYKKNDYYYFINFVEAVLRTLNKHYVPQKSFTLNTLCSLTYVQPLTPVSYTHLDVYKRQI